jgi:DNA polymerase I-like protein with 3'-5' exonuclease and polymerase domains
VLERLGDKHPIAALILKLRKLKKIKATYIDKILIGIDRDSRLRTGFHLHTVTSGRLSSSGKLNMQQLPRDDKRVKNCIDAPEGYSIVSQDLTTAEMYYAAVLSKDKNLQKIFSQHGDFHSNIARMVFRLQEGISVPKHLRQASKAISFGILYGSGPAKVAEVVGCTVTDAKGYIQQYFQQFPELKKWLDRQKLLIMKNGYTYSFFGRKRRVPEVKSSDQQIAGGGVRSAVNFLIQSVASDCNLLAAIEMNQWLKTSEVNAEIFGLVHDSILAIVKNEDLDNYCARLAYFTKLDRGISIKGSPIGLDVEIGSSYAFL